MIPWRVRVVPQDQLEDTLNEGAFDGYDLVSYEEADNDPISGVPMLRVLMQWTGYDPLSELMESVGICGECGHLLDHEHDEEEDEDEEFDDDDEDETVRVILPDPPTVVEHE